MTTKTKRPSLARTRLAYLAQPSLRMGLPGDGRPRTGPEAERNCPHRVVRHLPLANDRYWLAGERRPFAVEYTTQHIAPGEHVCIDGWLL